MANFARGAWWFGVVVLSGCAVDALPRPEEKVWIAVAAEDRGLFEEVSGKAWSPNGRHGDAEVGLMEVPESMLGSLAGAFHADKHRCGGFLTFADRVQAEQRLKAVAPAEKIVVDYALKNPALVAKLRDGVVKENILDTIKGLSGFATRYYTKSDGKKASEWLRDRWQGYIGARSDAHVALWTHSWLQPSVVLTIDGTSAADEVVVVGGHIDSIAGFFGSSSKAPGADDDASGIATLSEVARVMLESGVKPSRTVKFIAYAAEEAGLRGSAAIADKFAADGVKVVGVLQLDMVAYKGTAVNDININTSFSDPAQNEFLKQLVITYLPELKVGTMKCGYACSDHASWHDVGVPASNPFEADMKTMNPKIHSTADTVNVFGNNADHAVKFGRLTAAYVAELGGGS